MTKGVTQKEILNYYHENGGLNCADWSLKEIKKYIKLEFGQHQRVYESTCWELRQAAKHDNIW